MDFCMNSMFFIIAATLKYTPSLFQKRFARIRQVISDLQRCFPYSDPVPSDYRRSTARTARSSPQQNTSNKSPHS